MTSTLNYAWLEDFVLAWSHQGNQLNIMNI